MKTLNYLDTFWQKAKTAIEDIRTELPKVETEDILKPIGTTGKMWVIQYKDLGDKWGVKEILQRERGVSINLSRLCDKIEDLFEKNPADITLFLKATAEKGYFVRKAPFKGDDGIKIQLTTNEIARLKLYISENI